MKHAPASFVAADEESEPELLLVASLSNVLLADAEMAETHKASMDINIGELLEQIKLI